MAELRVSPCSRAKAQATFERMIREAIHGPETAKVLCQAFQAECESTGVPRALDEGRRSYYIVTVNSREEALFGINFHRTRRGPGLDFHSSGA